MGTENRVSGWVERPRCPVTRNDVPLRSPSTARFSALWRLPSVWGLPGGSWRAFSVVAVPILHRGGNHAPVVTVSLAQDCSRLSACRPSEGRQKVDEASVPPDRADSIGTDEMGQVHVRIVGTVRLLDEDGIVHRCQEREIVETVSKADSR